MIQLLTCRASAVGALAVIAAAAASSSAHAQCEPRWSSGRGFPGTNGPVSASISWDADGPGGQAPLAVVGGSFNIAGDAFANNVAAWNGVEWTALGGGIPGTNSSVQCMAVFDDGSGPALYAGGFFNVASGAPANYIARWDGSTWTSVGGGMDGRVASLAVFDDGSGPALYAGGAFIHAGGGLALFIAKWDGTTWSPVGAGVNSWVLALTVFNDGSGPALFAGGMFTLAGGAPARFAAKWNGLSWSDLDTGEVDGVIYSLTTYDDGGGTDLYAGGDFTLIGTEALANFVARWNGSQWSGLAAGATGSVLALTVFDDAGPAAPALVAGGFFPSAGIVDANNIASWNGSTWSSLDNGVGSTVTTLAVVDDGTGEKSLYAGGVFNSADELAARHVAKWDGSSWSNLGTGSGMNAAIYALTEFDDGNGPALYAGGGFAIAGGILAGRIAKWDSETWTPLGTGTNFQTSALAVFNDGRPGSSDELFAGGSFLNAGGSPANYIASWDGSSWSPAGAGTGYIVTTTTVFDDGSGPALYVGGGFTTAGGAPASFIARWNGAHWSSLASGTNNYVYALSIFDDGTGPALYAGGAFTTAGGGAANFVAKWNGSVWSPLGSGTNGEVWSLASFDDGSGQALYAGGFFSTAGGNSANRIAKWNGAAWSPVGTGMSGGAFPAVLAMTAFDDGGGPALYAGGQFSSAGGTPASCIAMWNGASWTALSSGLAGTSATAVRALTVFDDRSGPALYVGGVFDIAGGIVSAYWARWGCHECSGDIDGSGSIGFNDLTFLLLAWGTCVDCPEDIDGNGTVGFNDLTLLLLGWGECA